MVTCPVALRVEPLRPTAMTVNVAAAGAAVVAALSSSKAVSPLFSVLGASTALIPAGNPVTERANGWDSLSAASVAIVYVVVAPGARISIPPATESEKSRRATAGPGATEA